jgi:hypothetical protein
MLQRRSTCVMTVGVTLLVALAVNSVADAGGQAPIAGSGQASAQRPSGQAAGMVTTYERQYQTVNETVYVTESYQVPVTQLQTRYRTEYQSKTVPVRRWVTDQVPVTATQIQHRQESGPQIVEMTRTITEEVPVTETRTDHHIEYRTERIPVKRTVFEVVNVPRTVTTYRPEQRTETRAVTRIEMVPVTKMQTLVQYETVMKTVKATQYQPRPVTTMVSRVVTKYTPQNYTVTVPQTNLRQVVEECGSYETRMVPVTSAAPDCSHRCGHRCGGGCRLCGGGAGGCCTTVLVCERVFVSRPVVRSVPETTNVEETRTRMVPVQETVQVPETHTESVPVMVDVQVSEQQPRTTEVSVTVNEPKEFTENVTETKTIMVPEQKTELVPTVQAREVTGYDLRLISWGDGSNVPTSGRNLVVAGTDSSGLLHVRTFDAAGVRIDTYEAMKGGAPQLPNLVSANAAGTITSDSSESSLAEAQLQAIAELKRQLPGLLPPHVRTQAEGTRVLGQAASITGQNQVTGYDLQLVPWEDGSKVPTTGRNLVIAGTDSNGLLHVRTFDAAGVRTDTYEAMKGGAPQLPNLVSADASGTILSDSLESRLTEAQVQAIADLKRQLPGLLPPHERTEAEDRWILGQAASITGQKIEPTEYDTKQVPISVAVKTPVTTMVTRPKRVTEDIVQQGLVDVAVPVTTTIMTTQYRPITEYVTQQVPVRVPEQVPVTVMTTQTRQVPRQVAVTRSVMVPVTRPAATPQTSPQGPGPSPQK